ncbi:MAG TPA: hypothetical protein ENJ84_09015 [Gammaproteobacteria bacterium]|nr:hypothetical protein [Gammaproteobacteria bacterium]
MKIIHHIAIPSNNFAISPLQEYKLTAIKSGPLLTVLEINDDDKHWSIVRRIAVEQKYSINSKTIFSKDELDSAHVLEMVSDWHNGYPQPEDKYKQETFECATCCTTCGIGYIQKAPFQLKGVQKWGRRKIFQLNWIYDAYFVEPNVWEHVFKEFRIDAMEVIDYKRKRILENVVQLIIPSSKTTIEETDCVKSNVCKECGRVKYEAPQYGMFPKLDITHTKPLFKIADWFGSGAYAFNPIFVSAELYVKITEFKLKGVSFIPVRDC